MVSSSRTRFTNHSARSSNITELTSYVLQRHARASNSIYVWYREERCPIRIRASPYPSSFARKRIASREEICYPYLRQRREQFFGGQSVRTIFERSTFVSTQNVMNRENTILEIQERYRQSGRSFNELERRLWAATEAVRLGRGGITVVSRALRISPNTIKRGIQELGTIPPDSSHDSGSRIRKPGGGRKSINRSSDQNS